MRCTMAPHSGVVEVGLKGGGEGGGGGKPLLTLLPP